MTKPWIVLGGGGHASVVVDTLRILGHTVIGYTDPANEAPPLLGVECLGGDDSLAAFAIDGIFLANGLGSTASTERRSDIYRHFISRGYGFPAILHPSAVVAASVHIGAGTQVMAGSVLQPSCKLGENVLINTRASVDHDCVIASDVHVAPGVTISGRVVIEEGAHIGTGATIVQCVRIGSRSVVGAGALVLRDVMPTTVVIGVPAMEHAR